MVPVPVLVPTQVMTSHVQQHWGFSSLQLMHYGLPRMIAVLAVSLPFFDPPGEPRILLPASLSVPSQSSFGPFASERTMRMRRICRACGALSLLLSCHPYRLFVLAVLSLPVLRPQPTPHMRLCLYASQVCWSIVGADIGWERFWVPGWWGLE